MNKALIEISKCEDCIHAQLKAVKENRCMERDNRIIEDIRTIPDWCPYLLVGDQIWNIKKQYV